MSVYKLQVVLQKWEKGELSTEQAVGQMLQHLQMLAKRIGELERQQAALRRGSGEADRH